MIAKCEKERRDKGIQTDTTRGLIRSVHITRDKADKIYVYKIKPWCNCKNNYGS